MTTADVQLDRGLLDRVRRSLVDTGAEPTPARVAAAVRAESAVPVGDGTVLGAVAALRSELVGAGPLEPLLADPATTDVLVNGPDEVWVDRGEGLTLTSVRFTDDDAVRRLAQRLAAAVGRRIDDSQPWVDARLIDGSRLHAVLAPISPRGTCLSLRVLRPRSWSLRDLIAAGSVEPEAAELIGEIIRDRRAFLVTGGTGSGKTTLLASLLGTVNPAERIIVVEDAGELRPVHPHVVPLESRVSNVEGAGAVPLRELVRQALRMRPDRLVVGEVRGAEVVDLLTALNTGHDGGAGTVHANSPADLPARLEALAALAGLGREALHSQLTSAIDCVLHMRRLGGARVLSEICALDRAVGGEVVISPVWRRDGGPCAARSRLGKSNAAG